MITEFIIVGAVAGLYKHLSSNKYKTKVKLKNICDNNSSFTNKNEDTLKIVNYKDTKYGYKLLVSIPDGLGFEDMKAKEDIFKTNLKAIKIDFKFINGLLELDVIKEPLQNVRYEPIDTQEGEILVGYGYKDYVKVNLNKFPHVLIGGDTGTGKSRLMLLILTNLINRFKDIEIYLIQIRKSDLAVFKDCKQVKYMARTLEQTRNVLRHLDNVCRERDTLLEKYLKYGIYNIVDYNKRFKDNKLNYIYIVLDEFAFFNFSGADTKEEKQLKKEILGYIKNIVLTGRSTGVFIFTSLQKPTSSSIPTDIKSQLTTRISFKMLDKETSIIVLGNANATELKEREAIVRTLEEELIKVQYIDHNLIMDNIKASTEPQHEYITVESASSDVIPSSSETDTNKVNTDGIIDLQKILNANF